MLSARGSLRQMRMDTDAGDLPRVPIDSLRVNSTAEPQPLPRARTAAFVARPAPPFTQARRGALS
jgi:hypothetical protein